MSFETYDRDIAPWLDLTDDEFARWEFDGYTTFHACRHLRAIRLLKRAFQTRDRQTLKDLLEVALDLEVRLLPPDFHADLMALERQMAGDRANCTTHRDARIAKRYWELRSGGSPNPWEWGKDDWKRQFPPYTSDDAIATIVVEFAVKRETVRRIVRLADRSWFAPRQG